MQDLHFIAKILKEQKTFLILTHQFPDGDTLGSAFALFYALKKLGKKATVLCNDQISARYNFLGDLKEIISYPKKDEPFNVSEKTCIVSVDIADTKLLGENLEAYKEKIDICIDHHASNKQFAKHNYFDPDAAATAEIIYDIINMIDVSLDSQIADCIYAGIATDTGSFKYINTTAKTHEIAAKMLKYGARYNLISRRMFEEKTKARIFLEKLVLNSIQFFYNGQCAVICITQDMLKTTGATQDDTEGLSGLTRSIQGVKVGITIREQENQEFKISLRCEKSINAAEICKQFGGGGHSGAAGCSLFGSLEEVKIKILNGVNANLNVLSNMQ